MPGRAQLRTWLGGWVTTPVKQLWVDATFGVAGDMVLAALIDAGASLDRVRNSVTAVAPEVRIHVEEVRRGARRSAYVTVTCEAQDHHHRSFATIRDLLAGAEVPERVRRDALAVFEALAVAEGRVHGVAREAVEFHEVGAWDSIADVVGVCAALDDLGVATLTFSPVGLGSGTVRGAHGVMSVPAPAVVELMRGHEPGEFGATVDGELATPTGVALLTTLGTPGTGPVGVVSSVGVGAGTKDFQTHANVVSVVLSESSAADGPTGLRVEMLHQLETNVDDLDPRLWPDVLATLLGAGARDAWLTPILMKKGRPAHIVSALVDGARLDAVRMQLYRSTTTIGIRETVVRRTSLPREMTTVMVRGQEIRVKVSTRPDGSVVATPEYDDVRAVADHLGVPVREVLMRAQSEVLGEDDVDLGDNR